MTEFLDLFSTQAEDYARYRPRYPAELFEHLAAVAPSRRIAWDCATGNGQAAVALSRHFERVLATDASAAQITHAGGPPNVEYRVARAEDSAIESDSIDLVTVATAIHWFDLPSFLAEAKRVLTADGVLCFWTYAVSEMDESVSAVVRHLSDGILAAHWSERVKALWEDGYAAWSVNWPPIELPTFEARAEWTVDELRGYLRTWSATQSWAREHGSDPTDLVVDELQRAYGDRERIAIRWPLQCRAFRRPTGENE